MDLIASSSPPRLSRRLFSVVAIALAIFLVVMMAATGTASAATTDPCDGSSTQNNLKVASSHGKAFYIDSSSGIDAAYIGYRVTDTSNTARSGLWISLESFSGGVVTLANPLDRTQQIPTITANGTKPVYALLKATSSTTTAQRHTVRIYDRDPSLAGASELYSCSYSFSKVKETIKASSNSVGGVTVTAGSLAVGQTVTVTVTGNTGTISDTGDPDPASMWFSPAGKSTWPTRALKLEGVQVVFGAGAGQTRTFRERLLIAKSGTDDNSTAYTIANSFRAYTATYTFRVIGSTSSQTTVSPVAQVTSGGQMKHTDTGGANATATWNTTSANTTNPLSLAKRVTSSSSLTTTVVNGQTFVRVPYELKVTSTSSTNSTVSEIVDTPAAGTSFATGTAKLTDVNNTNATRSDPSTLASEASLSPTPLHYTGPFTVNSTTPAVLTYTMLVPCDNGTYGNKAYAVSGAVQFGSSATLNPLQNVTTQSGSCGTVTAPAATTVQADVVVETQAASPVGATSATLNALIDGNGQSPTATFTYSTSPTLANPQTAIYGTVTGSDPTAISVNLTGLDSSTTFYYRANAGDKRGEIMSFTTLGVVATPTATTTAATGVSTTGVTLNGSIDANLTSTTVTFTYGTSASLVGATTVNVKELDDLGAETANDLVLAGNYPTDVAKTLSGLSANTTYYYRVNAVHSGGTVPGSILSFKTGSAQTITFAAIADKLTSSADFSVSPSSSSGLTVSLTSDTPTVCTVGATSPATVHIVAEGTCTLTATQAGNATYATATPVSQSFNVFAPPAVTISRPDPSSTLTSTTPAIEGTCEGSNTVTVKLYAGNSATGSPTQTLTAACASERYIVTATTLADGTYTVKSQQTDATTGTGYSSAVTFTIDTTAPTVTVTQPANASQVASATPTISGSCTYGDGSVTVKVYAGMSATGSPAQTLTAACGVGGYTTAPTSLIDGIYTIVASQTDAAGNTGTSATRTFTVDTVAPVVTVTAPSAGAAVATATPTLSGSCTTGDGTVTVKAYAGGSATGSPTQTLTTSCTAGSWSTSPTSLVDGTYTVTASQTDAAGNTGTSTARSFTVDTAAPVVTVTTPSAGAAVATATPALSGACTSGDGTVTIKLYAGGSATGSPAQTLTTSCTTGSWSTSPSTLAEGTYTVTASQTDAAGNTGTSAERSFTVDLTAPVVTVPAPSAGAQLATATPTLSGACTTGDGTVTVKLYTGGSATGSPTQTLTTSCTAGSWSTSPTSLTDGTYTVTASQTDAAGNTGTSTARSFTVDLTAPQVAVSSPADGSTTSTATPTLSGTCTSGDGTVTVKLYAGGSATGSPTQTLTTTCTVGTWSTSPASLTSGTYTVTAAQTDAAGNSGTSTASSFVLDTSAPAVTIDTPTSASVTTNRTPTLSGTCSEEGRYVVINFYAGASGSGDPLEIHVLLCTLGSWTTGVAQLDDGPYSLTVSQTNEVGTTGSAGPSSFTVDTTAPVVTVTDPADGAVVGSDEPTLSGDCSAGDGDVTVKLYTGGGASGSPAQTLAATCSVAGAWSATPTALSDGTYTVTATQTDQAGNSATSAPSSFQVDTTAPQVTITTPTDGAKLTTATPTLSGVCESADGTVIVAISQDGTVETLTTACTEGGWSTQSGGLSDGTYSATASQTDQAGNTGTSTGTGFQIKTNGPTVTLTTPTDDALLTDSTPELTGACVDGESDVTVRLYAGQSATGTALQTLTSACTDGVWSATPTALEDDLYTAVAEQTDSFALTGSSGAHSFTIDTTAPEVTITTPAAASTSWDPSPSVLGACADGDGDVTLELYVGSSATGSPAATVTVACTEGSWSATVGPLDDGDYTVLAHQTDAAGQRGDATAVTFTIDQTAPVVTITAPTADAIGADPTPTLTGTCTAGDGDVTIELYAGASAAGAPAQTLTATCDAGMWSIAPATLADGIYTLAASQTDTAGHTTTTESVSFTVDTTAPLVTITVPTDGTILDASPTASGACETSAGQVTVAIYAGETAAGTPIAIDTATCTEDTWSAPTELADGTYTAQASQTDAAGNAGQSTATTFTVDTVAPTLTIDSPTDGALLADSTPTVSGSCIERHTITLRIYAGTDTTGAPIATATATCDGGVWSVTSDPLNDGIYSAIAEQTDDAGNVGSTPATGFTIDTTAPLVTITDPLDGSTVTDPTPTILGDCTDADGDVTVVIYAGAAATGAALETTQPSCGEGTYAVELALLQAGTYTVTATQTDSVGNSQTVTVSFLLAPPAPVVLLADPADESIVATSAVTITGSCDSDAGDVTIAVYAGSTATGSAAETLTARCIEGAFTTTTSALADGTYTTQATQTSSSGVQGDSTAHTFTVDTTAPEVTITVPTDGALLADSTPALQGACSAGDGNVTVRIYSGTDTSAPALATMTVACTTGSWSTSAAALDDGDYTVVATQTDGVGNAGTSESVSFTIDATAPGVTINTHPDDPTAQLAATFSFSSTEPTASFRCRLDDGPWSTCTSPLTYSNVGAGSHTFTVEATDEAGNTSTDTYTWTVDVTAPGVTITTHPTSPTQQTTANFSFNSTDPTATLECQLDDGAWAPCTSPQSLTGLSDGTHTFRVRATDPSGNQSSTSYSWTIDRTTPSVLITSSPANPTAQTSAAIAFSVNDLTATVECRIDGGAWTACSSPVSYSGLAAGAHTVTVRATDPAGNQASTQTTWTIDPQAPALALTTQPPAYTNQTTATLTFTASIGATVECQLDGGSWTPCSSPITYTGLAAGSHTVVVRATSAAGVQTTAQASWIVDLTPPQVTITQGPAAQTTETTATFTFATDEPTTATCSLDGAAPLPCTSPYSVSGLTVGEHALVVRVIDRAGNVTSSTVYRWTVVAPTPTPTPDAPPLLDQPNIAIAIELPPVLPIAKPFVAQVVARNVSPIDATRVRVDVEVPEGLRILGVSNVTIREKTPVAARLGGGPERRLRVASDCSIQGQTISCIAETLSPTQELAFDIILDGVTKGGRYQFKASAFASEHPQRVQSSATVAQQQRCTITGSGRIVGTPGPDVICGSSKRDVIYGRGGDDVIVGFGGNDILYGGRGDDRLDAGDDRDYLDGGPGADDLRGGRGNDQLLGRTGNDRLRGDAGADLLLGGWGATIFEADADDTEFILRRGATSSWDVQLRSRPRIIVRTLAPERRCALTYCIVSGPFGR